MKPARPQRSARSETVPAATPKRRRATGSAARAVPASRLKLPAMTFGQLRLLAHAGTPLPARIRRVARGYRIEVDLGPRRWVLVSTHGKHPRLFRHLDGAANALRDLGAQEVILELGGSAAATSAAASKSNRSR